MSSNIGRFFKDSAGSYFVFGPRGTGKSTWLNRRYGKALVVDLLGPDEFRQYNSRPERLIELVEGNPKSMEKTPLLL